LSAARISGGYVPILVSLGLIVAFLTEPPRSVATRSPSFRLDCRGPPAAC
jgi:hypothetical protein